ncbi:hypothetical protein FOMPIDRAFT_1054292 [Fomitopsis schrenkii]|uniref:F-box domain-containing protein n=1 Tax=Fomitopsis schrenkii TaxID=2126942 RepID=S8DRJ5_FOMSC|nr:hypothetical protein FOMPIDRAFT_1054292 [Fomitopsis schrenkii]
MCGSAGLECISRLSGDICSLALMIHGPFVRQSSLYHNLSALARSSRTLRYLELTLRGLTDLYTILRVVPSLRTLHMYTCRFPTFTPVDAPYIDLDELIADAPVPLTCTVRRVEFQFNPFFHHEPDWLPLLERMAPVVLSCHAGWSLPARDVARNLSSLQHLELHVRWRISDGVPDTPPEAWLTSFVSVFSPVKLVGLVLHIRTGVLVDPTVSLDVLARDIVGACNSSLQFIGISLERHPLLDVPITHCPAGKEVSSRIGFACWTAYI